MSLLARVPLHPLLFAAYAVLFLYAANISEVLVVDIVAPLGRSVIGAVAVLAGAALLFRDARRGAIVASAVLIAFYAFGHAAPLLAGIGLDERTQLAAWALLVTAAVAYAAIARETIPAATTALNAFAIVLVVLSLVTVVPFEASRVARAGTATTGSVGGTDGAGTDRDVYFLVFDRYGSADSIERRFGITGPGLYGWLGEQGFEVAAESHANYRATDFSLAATLNMRFLDELTRTVGRASSDRTPARALLRDHEVGRLFHEYGYRYYHLGSWFGATATNPMADENVAFGTESEFESVLGDTTVVPAVERALGTEEAGLTFRDRHREIALFQFRQLRRLASVPGPKFVFAHVLLPHAPYVFRADGSIIPEDVSRASDEGDLYRGQLAYLDGRIRELVSALLAGPPERDPIVILQADEGPFICRNVDCALETPEDYAIRFGILDALYLPGLDEGAVPSTFTPVNTFRLVFREYFGADLEPLPDRSFTWPDNDHLYDFRDVTDILANVAPP